MKYKLLILSLLIVYNSYSQRFNGYVVTNSNDTIRCKFFVDTNFIDRSIINAAYVSLNKKIKILTNDSNEKLTFKTNEIKSFLIKGTSNGDLKFVSFEQDNYKRFYHEVIKGKLSYYKLYKPDGPYDMMANERYDKYIFKDNFLTKLGLFDTRETLGKHIDDYPELHLKWMDSNNFYKLKQVEEVINKYNEYHKN